MVDHLNLLSKVASLCFWLVTVTVSADGAQDVIDVIDTALSLLGRLCACGQAEGLPPGY